MKNGGGYAVKPRKLTLDEKTIMQLVFTRQGCPPTTVRRRLLDSLRIGFVIQQPFTMATVVIPKKGKLYGFSKQCRYAKNADRWNEKIGREIALSRVAHQMCNGKSGDER